MTEKWYWRFQYTTTNWQAVRLTHVNAPNYISFHAYYIIYPFYQSVTFPVTPSLNEYVALVAPEIRCQSQLTFIVTHLQVTAHQHLHLLHHHLGNYETNPRNIQSCLSHVYVNLPMSPPHTHKLSHDSIPFSGNKQTTKLRRKEQEYPSKDHNNPHMPHMLQASTSLTRNTVFSWCGTNQHQCS